MNEVEEQLSNEREAAVETRTFADPSRSFASTYRSAASLDAPLATTALPRHVAGGFNGVADDLDRRSRDWGMMVRLLEQQRLQLETSEAERDRLHGELESLLPNVRTSAANLSETVDRTKGGDVSANLSALFVDNLAALDRLENVAKALTANLLWTRSSWEQYARSVIGAEKMRSDLRS